ncbi:hypothetical protein GDO81_015242 [Engystomops pustulosus]|uniref:Uncharacterized protein n=1 Tax=Engystomops pustulosus TaxID=76066 RepID=A0AAV7ANL4_ENGPU|nr:hypothetical protein GDO81_015242 [Engystomops pustulosus]
MFFSHLSITHHSYGLNIYVCMTGRSPMVSFSFSTFTSMRSGYTVYITHCAFWTQTRVVWRTADRKGSVYQKLVHNSRTSEQNTKNG